MTTSLSNRPSRTGPDRAARGGADQGQQFLTFVLDRETYAAGILAIKEILEYGGLTRVPMMPEFVQGVINLRGSVVPVIDLKARFGHGRTEPARRTCIVIVEVRSDDSTHDLGIMVDGVSEVVEIPEDGIGPAPAFGARIRNDFIRGMGKIGERLIVVLDLGRVLSVEEMAQLGGVDAHDPQVRQ